MSGSSKDAWSEVGDRFSEVGRHLSERYRALGDADAPAAEERRAKIEEALRATRDQLDRAFTSVGDTLRDPTTKDSLGRAVSSLGDAISATFTEAGDEIRKRFGQRSGSSRDAGDPGDSGASGGPAQSSPPPGE
jgi:hypothetical protein